MRHPLCLAIAVLVALPVLAVPARVQIGGDIGMTAAQFLRAVGPPDTVLDAAPANGMLDNWMYRGQGGAVYAYLLRNGRVVGMLSMEKHRTREAAERNLAGLVEDFLRLGLPVSRTGRGGYVVTHDRYEIYLSLVLSDAGQYQVWTVKGEGARNH